MDIPSPYYRDAIYSSFDPPQIVCTPSLDLAIAWECLFAFDSIIFGLTVYNAYLTRRAVGPDQAMPIHQLMVRDGAIYFDAMSFANHTNITTLFINGRLLPGSLATFATCTSVAMVTHLLLDLYECKYGAMVPNLSEVEGKLALPVDPHGLNQPEAGPIAPAQGHQKQRREIQLPADRYNKPRESPQKRKTFRPNQHTPDDAFGDAGGSGTLDTSTGEIFNLAGSAASEGGDNSEGENDAGKPPYWWVEIHPLKARYLPARNTSPTPGTPDSDAVLAPLGSRQGSVDMSVDDDEEMHPAPPVYNAANAQPAAPVQQQLFAPPPPAVQPHPPAPQNSAPQQQAPLPQVQMPAAPQPQLGAHQPLFGAPQVPFGAPPVVFGAAQQLQHAPHTATPGPPAATCRRRATPGPPAAATGGIRPTQRGTARCDAGGGPGTNPQLQMQPAQPIPPVNADGAAYYQHNAGQFHRHVVTNKQLLRYIPELQLTEYNESPHNRLAILLANAGNHVLRRVEYATPLEQQIREVLRALIPDGSITVNMPSLNEALQNTSGTAKYGGAITVLAQVSDNAGATRAAAQQTFGVHPSLTFWVHDLAANEAVRAWVLAQWYVAGAGGDDDGGERAAAYARAALVTIAFRNTAIFQMIDQHTQGKGGPASQRVYDALNTIHGEMLENPDLPNKPVLTLFMEPTTDNEEEKENLMHLLRIIPLNTSYYTFTPMSKTGEPPECTTYPRTTPSLWEGEAPALQEEAAAVTTAAVETVEAADTAEAAEEAAGEVPDAEAEHLTHHTAADITEPRRGEAAGTAARGGYGGGYGGHRGGRGGRGGRGW
ncbi:hypothetical protein B0H14DRAFT_3510768 [Mycena olivaceomarginata]|nr:hypothetical protein B0H14DRAFT_3510768 [Mycena olivaceomarginata]